MFFSSPVRMNAIARFRFGETGGAQRRDDITAAVNSREFELFLTGFVAANHCAGAKS
jgi:hypothetical protein